jgi:signal transduction histidine kinase
LSPEERYLRTRFLGALAHAIRSPLSVASGALEELAASPSEGELFLEIARRNLRRLDTLAEVLNRVADLESGTIAARLCACDIAAVLRGMTVAHEHPRRRDPVSVTQEIAEAPLLAEADPDLLSLALVQIIDNGVRFARSEVCIRAGLDQDTIWVDVEDDGAGIELERRERVFDRYTSARERGADSDLALGLSLARDYARLQGGQVRLRPGRSGRGTSCRLELRRAPAR